MGMRVNLDTKGLKDMLEALVKAGKDIDAAVPIALQAGADVLSEGMQRRAPVDTYNLRNHINTKGPLRDGNSHYIQVGVIRDKSLTDAKTARYAVAQEYGWADKTGAKAGQPYIRPTIESDMGKARKAMLAVLAEELRK